MTKPEIIAARKALVQVDVELLAELVRTVREHIEAHDSGAELERLVQDMLIDEYGVNAATVSKWADALFVLARAPRAV